MGLEERVRGRSSHRGTGDSREPMNGWLNRSPGKGIRHGSYSQGETEAPESVSETWKGFNQSTTPDGWHGTCLYSILEDHAITTDIRKNSVPASARIIWDYMRKTATISDATFVYMASMDGTCFEQTIVMKNYER